MRTIIYRTVAILILAWLPGVLAAQELALPRQELDDAIKAANEARIRELTAELKTVQKSIAGGAKVSGGTRRDAIIKGRKRESDIEGELAKIKKAPPMPELNIDKLAVGQVGKLYSSRVTSSPMTLPSANGPGGAVTVMTRTFTRAPVGVNVVEVIDGGGVLVIHNSKALWLRMATAGMTTGQKLTLNRPVKVVGTKNHNGETVFELAFFATGL
jgi:hypothetical protein